jgi:DNA-binding XRE family transcriptional regulator
MPKKKRPLIPPLSLSVLEDVEDVERYARNALRSCNDTFKFNRDKAMNILRTCAVEVFDTQIAYYSSVKNFTEDWVPWIGHTVIGSAMGLITAALRDEDYEWLENVLYETINAHFEARDSAKSEKPSSKSQTVKGISSQIDDLRNECRMTVEDLADALDVTPRSIYRHLSGEADPRSRQIAAYEKLFSEKLAKPIRLNTSVKRQTSSKRQ